MAILSGIRDTISVIIPIYNTKLFIEKCINSILNQTYPHLEILAIDNGSTDGSAEVLSRLAACDSRIRVLHKVHGLAASARNVGLKAASGKYIMFVDSDDFVAPNYAQTLLNALLEYKTDIAQCCFSRVVNGKLEQYLPYRQTRVFSGRDLCKIQASFIGLSTPMTVLWNKIYIRSVWDGIAFDESRTYEDIATTYKVLYPCPKIVFLADTLYYLTIHSKSATSSVYYKPDRVDEIYAYVDRIQYYMTRKDNELAALTMKRSYYIATQHLYKIKKIKTDNNRKQFLKSVIKNEYPVLMGMSRWKIRTKLRMTFIRFFPRQFGHLSLIKKMNFEI
jgi:glycosyltransferase involved in cell wall biosynthesis